MRALLEKHRSGGDSFPLIGGHRGCTCAYQENTIPAMAEGLMNGASYLEVDVQLSKDGIPVIFHDTDTEEKTGLKGCVNDFTFEELNRNYIVQSLEEVMNWGKANNVYFALELKAETYRTKDANIRLLPVMNEVITGAGMIDNVEAFGIDYDVLKRLKKVNKRLDIGLIVPFIPSDPVALMREMDAMIYLSYVFNLTEESIASLQKSGYYVSGAILRKPELIRYAIESQVDMFEHDYPEQFKGEERRKVWLR
jgi:Glycerophosphoryl diester phosphodiesterase